MPNGAHPACLPTKIAFIVTHIPFSNSLSCHRTLKGVGKCMVRAKERNVVVWKVGMLVC